MKKVYVDGSTRQTCTVIDGVARVLPACPLGEKVTNNQGEYYAILAGLQRAYFLGLKEIEILSDSQLVIRQLNTRFKLPTDVRYAIKNVVLQELADIVVVAVACFDKVVFKWIPREENPAGEVLG